ncbi:MAG: nitroreductase family protein [Anaerolineales bacterium]|nr:nitroreductase family protein [Anaerolineales bacterium]
MNLATPDNLTVVDHLLTTTRSVRRRLDFSRPVERAVIERCLAIAVQAPSGSNRQTWHFVIVTDPAKKAAIGGYYRQAFAAYLRGRASLPPAGRAYGPSAEQMGRVRESSQYLADHMPEAPVLILPCIEGRVEARPHVEQASQYGSILPAVWSLMLALRARGLGAAWTTLHLVYEKEVAQLLGLPEGIAQVALLPVAYFSGEDFRPADRVPAENFTHWDAW